MENRCFRGETLFEKGKHISTLQKARSAQPLRKTNLEEYDLVAGGSGGTIAACTFAKQGQRVVVIERKYVGGSCPNRPVCSAKTPFTARRLSRTFAEANIFGVAKSERLQMTTR
jgi:hypothetical protein